MFRKIGMLIGVSIVQGGSGYPFFAPCFYSYLCGADISSIIIGRDEIPHGEIRMILQEV